MNLHSLGLTPAQLAELEQADQALVEDWVEHALTAHGVKSPAGLVLAGVRSGNSPRQETDKAFVQAERYIRQVGYLHQSEQELRDELACRKWPADERLVELWRLVRPIGQRLEREAQARMQDLGKRGRSAPRDAQTLHSSQVAVPLTAVGVVADPDADIDWTA